MMKLSNKIEKTLKDYDISICGKITERYNAKDTYDIELETYSPEGEDIIISLVYDGTDNNFVTAFTTYANWFDADEHAEMWIESRGKNGVPDSIRDLIEDAEWIKNMLLEVAEVLNNFNKDTEEPENINREQEVKEIISVEILKKMRDSSAAHVLREILFDKNNKIDWEKAGSSVVANMPELKTIQKNG